MTNGSCQSRCESKVQTWLKPCVSAWRASSTTRDEGGFVCSTTPTSMNHAPSLTVISHGRAYRGLAEVLGETAFDVGTMAGPAVEGAVVNHHAAAREHGVDVAVDLETLPGRVIHVHVMGLAHADAGVAVRVVDHHVGVGTRRDHALLAVEAEHPRGRRGAQFHPALQRDPPIDDTLVQQVHPVLDR